MNAPRDRYQVRGVESMDRIPADAISEGDQVTVGYESLQTGGIRRINLTVTKVVEVNGPDSVYWFRGEREDGREVEVDFNLITSRDVNGTLYRIGRPHWTMVESDADTDADGHSDGAGAPIADGQGGVSDGDGSPAILAGPIESDGPRCDRCGVPIHSGTRCDDCDEPTTGVPPRPDPADLI